MDKNLISKINELIADGSTEKAIKLLLNELSEFDISLHQRLLILSNRYAKLQKERNLGLNFTDNENEILLALLNVTKEVKEKYANFKPEVDIKNDNDYSKRISDNKNKNSTLQIVSVGIIIFIITIIFFYFSNGKITQRAPLITLNDNVNNSKNETGIESDNSDSLNLISNGNADFEKDKSQPEKNKSVLNKSLKRGKNKIQNQTIESFCKDNAPIYVQSIYYKDPIVQEIIKILNSKGCKSYGGEQVKDDYAKSEIRYFAEQFEGKAKLIKEILMIKLNINFQLKYVSSLKFRPENLGQIDIYYK